MSEFRVEKAKAAAILALSNGATVCGCFFIAGSSPTRHGPERVADVLNAEDGFFPFEVTGPRGLVTALYHRAHVVMVTIENRSEPEGDPGYSVAARRWVSMLLSNGTRLTGAVRVYTPPGHERLSDYARAPGAFRYLETGTNTLIINFSHVVELVETEE
jgi:hypothetical protein